jgi:hypothetical protein
LIFIYMICCPEAELSTYLIIPTLEHDRGWFSLI